MDEHDFESLLDAAFGIETSHDKPVEPASDTFKQVQQLHAYDSSSSLEPSPASSPVHTYPSWVPGGSPCLSDTSMQMHASPADHGSGAGQSHLSPLSSSVLLYSPVRDGSPSPNEQTSPRITQPPQVPFEQRQQQQQQQDAAAVFPHSQMHQQMHQEHPHAAAAARPPKAPATASSSQHTLHTKHRQNQQQLSLCALPREVQMRVLCFLSADSLTSLAQTCCQLSSLCNEPVLWRRMFVHRWGKNVRHSNRQSWKVRYMECDAAELQASGAGLSAPDTSDSMQNIFMQAHRAKRHKALGAGAVDDLMLVEDDDVAAKVMAWRKSRGFATQPGPDSNAPPQRPADLAAPHPSLHPSCQAPQVGLVTHAGGSGAWSTGGRRRVVQRPAAAATADTTGAATRTPCAAHSGSHGVPVDATDTGTRGDSISGGGGVQTPRGNAAIRLTAAAAAAGLTATQPGPATGTCHQLPLTPCQQPSPSQGVKAASPPAHSSSGSKQVAKRRRSRQPRRWTQIGNVFCDEKTGWVHVCDETCSEKIVESSSGLLVCPISGTCSARLLTCAEEAEEEGDRDPDKEHREEDCGGERGRLARAFAAGYYCSDEQELLRECGAYLPH